MIPEITILESTESCVRATWPSPLGLGDYTATLKFLPGRDERGVDGGRCHYLWMNRGFSARAIFIDGGWEKLPTDEEWAALEYLLRDRN